MSWRFKTALLVALAIPAFSGYPVNQLAGEIVPGARIGWLGYGVAVHAAVWALLGIRTYRVAVLASLLVALPVVVLGTGISFAALLWRGWDPALIAPTCAHYISLAITMLTVIPLALSMVAVIPFHRFEYRLLRKNRGVSLPEKSALMFLRVFSHILYFVIPNILEVIREEGFFSMTSGSGDAAGAGRLPLGRRLSILVRVLVQIGVEGICDAVRYVPLWADEISRLPDRDRFKKT